jgi:predicted dehydrogenase
MSKLNVGIVGTGRLGSIYARMFSGRIRGAKLLAVAGHSARELATELDVPFAYEDRMDLFSNPALDAIVIASTTATHPEFAIAALETGNPVFCEKPPALTLFDTERMKEAVEQNAGFFHMGFMRRFDPGYMAMKSQLGDGGNPGRWVNDKPVLFRAKSRDRTRTSIEYAKTSGGLIFDMGIHDFDLANWLVGPIDELTAYGTCMAYPELTDIGDIDNATIMLKFRSGATGGALGVIDLSRNAGYGYDIETEVLTIKGAVRVQNLRDHSMDILSHAGFVMQPVVDSFVEKFDVAFANQLQDFIDRVRLGKPPSVTINDGIAAVKAALAATWSLKAGASTSVDDFDDDWLADKNDDQIEVV